MSAVDVTTNKKNPALTAPLFSPDRSYIFLCAHKGDIEQVKAQLKCGKDPKAKDEDGRNCLHWACAGGNLALVQYLWELKCYKINCVDEAGWTPLMIATSSGHADIVHFLIASQADADIPNENGQIPLHYLKGRDDIAELLLPVTEDVDRQDRSGSTPLLRACSRGNAEVVKMLLNRGANVNLADKQGNTPLHMAAVERHAPILSMLSQAGADACTRNADGSTALELAPASLRLNMAGPRRD